MKALFMWQECRPNLTEYQQTSVILNPQKFVIAVEVPMKVDYIFNYAEVANAELTNQTVPEPIYTPKAIKYCLDKLGEFITNKVTPDDFKQKPNDEDDEDDEEEWETEPEQPKKSTKVTDEVAWEEDIDTDEKDENYNVDEDITTWEEEK